MPRQPVDSRLTVREVSLYVVVMSVLACAFIGLMVVLSSLVALVE
jgi:hypothetical protein